MKCLNEYCDNPQMDAEEDYDLVLGVLKPRRNYLCGECGLEAHWCRRSGLVVDFDPGELTEEGHEYGKRKRQRQLSGARG